MVLCPTEAEASSGPSFISSSNGNVVRVVRATAIAPIASTSVAEAQASTAKPAPAADSAVGKEAASYITALPSDIDARAALADNLEVAQDFDVGGASDILGQVVLGGGYSDSGSGISQTYISRAYFDLDMTSLLGNSQDLMLGLLDTTVEGNGFDNLSFQVVKQGVPLIDVSFDLVAVP